MENYSNNLWDIDKLYSISDIRSWKDGVTYLMSDNIKPINARIATKMAKARVSFNIPEVGDVVIISGQRKRIAMIYETTSEKTVFQPCDGGSFALHNNGRCSMSGGLNDVERGKLILRGKELASFWFASQGCLQANSAVHGKIITNKWTLL